jgi:hypothetical protein
MGGEIKIKNNMIMTATIIIKWFLLTSSSNIAAGRCVSMAWLARVNLSNSSREER